MILVLASYADKAAAAFVSNFTNAAASLFTCSDLAINKTSLRFPDFDNSHITINDRVVPVKEIKGVINLLPAVFPNELFFYPPAEREYQSAEFHALLTFFLCALRCPVINKPTSLSLNGPFINPMSWTQLAYANEIPLSQLLVASNDRSNNSMMPGDQNEIYAIYLDGKIISSITPKTDDYTSRLASSSGVRYLKASFRQEDENIFHFIRAETIPDVKDEIVVRALIDHFNLQKP